MSDLDALALLDAEGSEGFVLAEALTPARAMHYLAVFQALEDDRYFMVEVADSRPLPQFRVRALRALWVAENGLVDGDDLRRLTWLLRRFWSEIEVDLLPQGIDVAELWATRRWRRLLNMIDHLPRATWTVQAMSNDPEYTEQVRKSMAGRATSDEPYNPPLLEHTPTVSALASVVDAVNAVRATLIMVNSAQGAAAPDIKPYPRPRTLLDTMGREAQDKARWTAHEKLADRLLARRQQAPSEAETS